MKDREVEREKEIEERERERERETDRERERESTKTAMHLLNNVLSDKGRKEKKRRKKSYTFRSIIPHKSRQLQ
jgi:hypothetical protein